MIERAKVLAGCALFALGAAAVTEACRAPTQAELDISTNAECKEIGAVALVVSGDPVTAEARVGQAFYAAQTTDCDVNQFIGSLVVTPGDDQAAVVVISPPAGTPITDCQPPKYAGCIVARRAFSFIDHVSLKIPISLDVECRDVPCDAFSTCRKGACYSSATSCDDAGACRGIGELPDGGLSPDAEVIVDGSPPQEDGPSITGDDSGSDASDGSADADAGDAGAAFPPGLACDDTGESVECGSAAMTCGKSQACCANGASFTCGDVTSDAGPCVTSTDHYCCTSANCGGAGVGTKISRARAPGTQMPLGGFCGSDHKCH